MIVGGLLRLISISSSLSKQQSLLLTRIGASGVCVNNRIEVSHVYNTMLSLDHYTGDSNPDTLHITLSWVHKSYLLFSWSTFT